MMVDSRLDINRYSRGHTNPFSYRAMASMRDMVLTDHGWDRQCWVG